MRRVLSTVLAVALLLGLGALAVLALPNANASLVGAPAVSAAPEFNPAAPAAAENYNMVAMPLNAASQFTNIGGFNSQGLGNLINANSQTATMILRWDPARQAYDTWDPVAVDGFIGGAYKSGIANAIPLAVGGAYWALVNSQAPPVVSFVGDVPDPGFPKTTFVGGNPCQYNEFSVPLNQAALNSSDLLAEAIGGSAAEMILRWNATAQSFDTWDPVANDGFVGGAYITTAWETKIGYPYVICLQSAANGKVWP